ncbi:MBL fold metallo-hydrolase [Lacibacter sediminis]|uniref:MBL fold metallo-hydrolase n=1 Tax=Lacibacter sediminis TaxID=2760713 RepID=A0A7G5XK62_9BACT|nr:MBL fold metallo-hydrolase [Lacibacter sediminis]QNA45865.1 MBL fold metallo-hydrolase [Lacibacter sediminis]
MEKNFFRVIYLGGPTAILEIGGLRFMTDPTLDPAGSVYHVPNLTVEKTKGPATIDIGRIDIVLLSHDQHFDNFDHAGRLLVKKVSKTYTTVSGASRLKGTSAGLAPWQSEAIITPDGTEITITATPARHGPAGIEKIQGEVIGFLLSVKAAMAIEIYITGDTTYYEGVAEVAKRYNPDYVFLFAGGAQTRGPFFVTMGTNDAMDMASTFPDATIIPLHYEGWKHYTQSVKDIQTSYRVLGIDQRLKILEAGKTISLEATGKNQ